MLKKIALLCFALSNLCAEPFEWTLTNEISEPLTERFPQVDLDQNCRAIALWEAIDDFGNSVAVWLEGEDSASLIVRAARLASGSTSWVVTNNITAVAGEYNRPKVALSPFGEAVAIWVEGDIIRGARLRTGSNSWQETTTLTGDLNLNFLQQLALDSDGDAVLVFDSNSDILGARLPSDSLEWMAATSTLGTGGLPALTMNAKGEATAAWVGAATEAEGARLAPKSNTWISTGNLSESMGVQGVALDGDDFGNVIAVIRVGVTTLEGAILNQGLNDWVATEDIFSDGVLSFDIEVDPKGKRAVSIWQDPNGFLQAAILDSPFIPQPPVAIEGKQVINYFPTQTETANILFWKPSLSAVAFYNIFRNGVLIGSVQANKNLVFEDHNQKKGGAITYSVTAVTENGQQSEPVSFTIP